MWAAARTGWCAGTAPPALCLNEGRHISALQAGAAQLEPPSVFGTSGASKVWDSTRGSGLCAWGKLIPYGNKHMHCFMLLPYRHIHLLCRVEIRIQRIDGCHLHGKRGVSVLTVSVFDSVSCDCGSCEHGIWRVPSARSG